MPEDARGFVESLKSTERVSNDQMEMNMCAEEFDVSRLSKLMGPGAATYRGEIEKVTEDSRMEGRREVLWRPDNQPM
ncbi:hypothetical protein U1Q18_021586, partial [Sarracenia purpurea var. burkii]